MNEKLLLQDLVVLLAKKAGITQKDADRFYRELVQLVLDCIYENDIVKIKDFGTFKLVSINSRESIDVNTGEKIEIPAHLRLSFVPDRSLKELVNKPFAQFESVVLEEGVDFSSSADADEPSESVERKSDNKYLASYDPFDEDADQEDEGDDDLDISDNDLMPLESVRKMRPDRYISPIEPISSKTPEKRKEEKESKPLEVEDRISKPVIKPIIREDRPPISEIRTSGRKIEKISIEAEPPKEKPQESKPDRLEFVAPRIEKKVEESPVTPGKETPEVLAEPLEKTVVVPPVIPVDNDIPSNQANEIREKEKAPIGDIEKTADTTIILDKPVAVNTDNDIDDTEENYDYVDYEKQSELSKKKKRIPVIIAIAVIALFAIYQFAKLFDVTYDYEYYINRPHRLTLTDTLPYLDEERTMVNAVDTSASALQKNLDEGVGGAIAPVTSDRAKDKKENIMPVVSGVSSSEGVSQKSPSDLDALAAKLDSQSVATAKPYEISENLRIRVVNKAGSYLEKNSKP